MSLSQTYPGINVGWFAPLRLMNFCLIFWAIVGWLGFPSYTQTSFYLYCFVTLAALISQVFLRRTDYRLLFRVLIALTFVAEIVNEAGIVYSTGSLYSPFSILFLLTIVSSAMVYRLVGTLLIATCASLTFAFVTGININLPVQENLFSQPLGGSFFNADDAHFYSTFLHILIFYLVAFIAGYLAEKLQSKGIELDSASAALKKARLETGDILWHLNCGLVTIDQDGEIVYFNRTAESILGLSEAEVSGKHCRGIFVNQLTPLSENLMAVLNSQQRLSRSEFVIKRGDSTEVPIGLSTSTLYDEKFDTRGVIAIFQDLTEAKMFEQRIRQADKMAAIGELSACIAHEIRNPLASISGSVEVLKNSLYLEGDNDKLLSLIIKESTRLNKILSDFLLYACINRLELRKVEILGLISEVIEVARRHPSYRNNIRIRPISHENVVYISGDEDYLKQMLINLLVNAFEAIGDSGGSVQIETDAELDNGEIKLSVRDTGPGIPFEQLGKVFMPFHSTKKSGSGLGLSIVSRLADAMEGRVEASSELGLGTEFCLYLKKYDKANLNAEMDNQGHESITQLS
ncbi:MAG: ATP-binding protein [candidate division Zixibacteria bacterium]